MDICIFLRDAQLSVCNDPAAYELLHAVWVIASYEGKQRANLAGLTIQDDWGMLWPDPWTL